MGTLSTLLTLSWTRYEEVVQVVDDLPGVQIGISTYRSRNTDLRHWLKRRQPLAVHIHTVFDCFMVCEQGQRETIADDVHAPVDLLVCSQGAGLRWLRYSQVAGQLFDNYE